MIALDRVRYRYPDGVTAVDGLSLEVAAGERVVLLGANGSGKSTLLKLMNGLLIPDEGEVRYHGDALTARRLRDQTWSRRFRRETAMLFQHPEAMLFNPTVYDEIAYAPRQHWRVAAREGDGGLHTGAFDGMDAVGERTGMYSQRPPYGDPRPPPGPQHANVDYLVRDWAERMGLAHRLNDPPYRLSGGEKQRLCLAALLVLEPHLLLLDEPTANLDPRTTGWLVDYLLDRDGMTAVIATHNLALAAELGDRAVILGEDRRVLFDGPLEAAMADTDLLWRANLAHRHRSRRDGKERPIHVHGQWG